MIPKVSRVPRPGVGWFNAVADTVNHFQQNQFNGSKLRPLRRYGVVSVKNTDTLTIERFRPVMISGAIEFVAGEDDIVLEGYYEDGTDELGVFGIAQEAILPGTIGDAVIFGLSLAYVSGADGGRWTPTGGQLMPNVSGRAETVFAPSGSDERLAVVVVGSSSSPACINTWWLTDGATDPAGGTITFDLTINGVTDDVTFSIPSTIAQTITALELHSEIASGDVTIVGGTLPEVAQRITFRNNPTNIEMASNSLTASWDAPPTLRWEPA